MGTGKVLEVSLCFGCSGVCGKCVGAWTRVWGSVVVLCLCEL